MTVPLIVASKGRPNAPTVQALVGAGLSCEVWVEPQDYAAYRDAWSPDNVHLFELPENDRGLGYVRQQILEHARAQAIEWYWMLDDDISGFYEAHDRKCHRADARTVLEAAEQAIVSDAFAGQGALEYQQFAWSNAPGKVTRNSYADVAVLIRSSTLADFRPETGLKVDRDYTLQVIASGMDVIRTGWLAFSAPANGSNEGGLQAEYATDGREETDSRKLVELWPGVAEFKRKPNGRPDAKIHWRRARG